MPSQYWSEHPMPSSDFRWIRLLLFRQSWGKILINHCIDLFKIIKSMKLNRKPGKKPIRIAYPITCTCSQSILPKNWSVCSACGPCIMKVIIPFQSVSIPFASLRDSALETNRWWTSGSTDGGDKCVWPLTGNACDFDWGGWANHSRHKSPKPAKLYITNTHSPLTRLKSGFAWKSVELFSICEYWEDYTAANRRNYFFKGN